MSDIFSEVDEEVRRERLKKLWERYGLHMIAAVALVVLGVAGWRGYDWYLMQKSREVSTAFEAASKLAQDGKADEAQAAFKRVAGEGAPGYAVLARLREASELSKRDPKAAIAAYDALAVDSRLGAALQNFAAIRAAFVAADTATPAEMRRRLEPLAGPDNTFRHSARELLAVAAWKDGDQAALQRWTDAIAGDAETPADLRARVEVLSNLVAADRKS
ncbi:MAG: tetratricopeptide repeat protein [Pseudorhodoplanes sp.]